MPMRIGTEMPSFDGATEWLNATGAAAEAKSEGRPTLVHFWSVSCGICKENLPRVGRWRDERASEGLRVVAVHMPRYEADTDVETGRCGRAALSGHEYQESRSRARGGSTRSQS